VITAPASTAAADQALLVARYESHTKDLFAATLAWLLKEQGAAFDAYYAAHRGGGLFSHHGGTLLGGRHHAIVAEALARTPTTVVRLGQVSALDSLVNGAARRVVDLPDTLEEAVEAYDTCLGALGLAWPATIVAVQTQALPDSLRFGIAQYATPEAANRRAAALPLETGDAGLRRLAGLGVAEVWLVATAAAAGAHAERWRRAGLRVHTADTIAPDETYRALTARIARRWLATATGIDLCEPYLASYWLPYAAREGRLQVTAEVMKDAVDDVVALARDLDPTRRPHGPHGTHGTHGTRATPGAENVVFGRWGGGALRGCTSDEDLYALYPEGLTFQVIEPCRPVLSVLSTDPAPLPQPAQSPWDLEPSDAELAAWADEGKILATLQTHSGELSHDDAIVYTIDLAAATGIKAGIGVHHQRYAFDPDAVEAMQVPQAEGGALGLCEPVLHSTGAGIMVESLCPPARVAQLMREARARIADLAGPRFAPRGVYCFCDAQPCAGTPPSPTSGKPSATPASRTSSPPCAAARTTPARSSTATATSSCSARSATTATPAPLSSASRAPPSSPSPSASSAGAAAPAG
jgi:hypothetical protein